MVLVYRSIFFFEYLTILAPRNVVLGMCCSGAPALDICVEVGRLREARGIKEEQICGHVTSSQS